jgi:predicted transcriptional regulator of viral defense system
MSLRKEIPTSKKVLRKLADLREGEVFDYYDIIPEGATEIQLANILSRLVSQGKLSRLAKGKFFKPRKTEFGLVRPPEEEIIKSLTVKNGRVLGYETGLTLYNRMGLTTQVSNTIVIATSAVRKPKTLRGYKIKYSKQNVTITKNNIPILQLLDALQDIKTIPDTTVDRSFVLLRKKIIALNKQKQKTLINIVLKYNAATRALVGALFEKHIRTVKVDLLKQSLNPLSNYSIGISVTLLPNKNNWNII